MNRPEYLDTAESVYRKAALEPQQGLCCTTTPVWRLPGLTIPPRMLEMNYGCGSTVHPRDLDREPAVLYVGVGGGMELLQFAYFSRRRQAVIGIDPVAEMRTACEDNLREAARLNAWFDPAFIDVRAGDALELPLGDGTVDVAAQNCLFNIFDGPELDRALREMYRVLRPHGRLVLSDPVCEQGIPGELRHDARLRAECLSGALPIAEYLRRLTDTGFGTVEVRARRPYRVLDPAHFGTPAPILLESLEVCAIKDPTPDDGPCVFTGRAAIYTGSEPVFDDGRGHALAYNQPQAVCDKTAATLAALGRDDLVLTGPTWHYDGGGCC